MNLFFKTIRVVRPSVKRLAPSAYLDWCRNANGDHTFSRDANSCTVNAFAAAFNITLGVADAHLRALGRKPGRGFNTVLMMEAASTQLLYGKVTPIMFERPNVILGTECSTGRHYRRTEGTRKSSYAHMRVRTFLEKFAEPGKRYVVNVRGHAFAVINQKVRDCDDQANRILRFVYEVEPHVRRPGAINFPMIVNRQPL